MVRLLSLRHPGAVLRRPLLSEGERHRGPALRLRHLRRRLPGAAVRRPLLRAPGRPGGAQVHVHGDHRGDGPVDRPGRLPPHLRVDRRAGADPPGAAAPAPGARPRRRVRRRRDLRRRARPRGAARLRHELDPDHGDRRLLPVAPRHPGLPGQDDPRRLQGVGMAAAVPALAGPADRLDLHPGPPQRVARLPAHEGPGEGIGLPPARQLLPLPEQQVRLPRSLRRRGRAGCGLVHGAVLRPLLPHHHPEARLAEGLPAGRRRAPRGDALLRRLRQALRPHRPAQDHPRRLPARRPHLLPALPRPHPRRQSGARGVPGEPPGERRGHRLQLPHLRLPGDQASPTATR